MSDYLNAVCKVCGKKYHRCVSCEKIPGSWRLVACSPECWNKWLDMIEARKRASTTMVETQQDVQVETVSVKAEKSKKSKKAEETVLAENTEPVSDNSSSEDEIPSSE